MLLFNVIIYLARMRSTYTVIHIVILKEICTYDFSLLKCVM